MDIRRQIFGAALSCALTLSSFALAQDAAAPESARAAESVPVAEPLPAEAVPEIPVAEAPPVAAVPAPLEYQEIVVIAQKRLQREIDVPISITVLDEEFIAQQGISDLHDVSLYVPNTKINNNAVFPDFRIRGFGTSPLNPVFEQSVGLVLDGVPFGSKAFYQAALFDIKQVEVLRGPQGALHGKNTTAGLINVITQGPSDETTAVADLQVGDLGHRRIEAALGGPMVENLLNFRVAAINDQRDGYFSNTTPQTVPTAPDNPGARGREAYRVQLGFPDLLGSNLRVGYESSRSDLHGGYELNRVPQHTRNFIRKYDPNVDFEPNNLIGSFDHADGIKIDVDSLLANWNYDWNEWGLTAVGGHSMLKEAVQADSDFSPAPASFSIAGRKTDLTTLELRTASPSLPGFLGVENLFGASLGETDFIAGVLYQRRKIHDLFSIFNLNDPVIIEFLAVERGMGAVPVLPLLPVPLPAQLTEEQSTLFFDESAESYAAFGQVDWSFLPDWTLGAGLRWSQDSKQAHILRQFDTPNTLLFENVLRWEEFDKQVERSEAQLSPKISLNWQPSKWASLFVSWGNAFKAGGFNAFASVGDDLTYEPEQVSQWGFDAKLRLFSRGSLNISVFRMDLTDFQVLTADPTSLKISIKNAAKARAQGVEADLTYLLTGWLTLRGSLGYNDAKFLSFPIATCPQDRVNSDGDADNRCDISGKPLVRAPKWSNTLTAMLALPFKSIPVAGALLPKMFDNVGFVGTVTGEQQSEQFLNDDLDDRKKQKAFYRYRGSVGIGSLSQSWSLRLTAENLTDERTAFAIAEVPAVAPGHFYQIPEPGRILYGHFRWSF